MGKALAALVVLALGSLPLACGGESESGISLETAQKCLQGQGFDARVDPDVDTDSGAPPSLLVTTPVGTTQTYTEPGVSVTSDTGSSVQLGFYSSADAAQSAVDASAKFAQAAGSTEPLPFETVGNVLVFWNLDAPQSERDRVNRCIGS